MKILTLLIFVFTFAAINAQETQRYINVAGISEITLPADQVTFNIQIKTVDEEMEKSKNENDKSLNHLLNVLKKNKINSDSIEISPISFGKNYEYENGKRKQNGFFTRVEVSLTIKDLKKYYIIIDELSSDSSLEIRRSHYGISNYEEIHEKTYINALKAAKEKADYLVKSLGLKLGKVIEIDEFTNGQQFPYPYNVSEVKIATPENYGKVSIKRKIRAKFEIEN